MLRQSLITLLLVLGSNVSWASSVDDIQKLLSQNRFQEALPKIESLLSNTPDDVELRFLHATTLSELDQPEKAINIYEAIISEYPTLPEPRNNLAVLYAKQQGFEKAEGALQSALNTHPSYATAHENLSDIYKALASVAYNKAFNDGKSTAPAAAAPNLRLVTELLSLQKTEQPTIEQLSPAEIMPQVQKQETVTKTAEEVDISRVESRIVAWSEAWSEQDPDSYLEFYSADFKPLGSSSLATWQKQRRDRLKSPKFIKIGISNMQTTILSPTAVGVKLKQSYKSDRFAEKSIKLLLLKLEQDQWRIALETEVGK